MSQTHAQPSIIRRFVYGTMLLLVPVLAVFFLGVGPLPLPDSAGAFGAAAFAPVSRPKQATTGAQPTAAAEDVPEVKLNVWEYTGMRVSSPL